MKNKSLHIGRLLLGLVSSVGALEASAQCSTPGSLLTENYTSTTGWSIVDGVSGAATATTCYPSGTSNGSLSIASNAFKFVTASCCRPLYGYRSIPMLNNSGWTSEFTFTLNAPPAGGLQTNAPAAVIAAYTAGTQPPCTSVGCLNSFPAQCNAYEASNQDAIWVLLSSSNPNSNCASNTNQASWYFRLEAVKGTDPVISSTPILLQTGVNTYYIRVQRTWTDWATLSVYTDANHTNQIGSTCLHLDPTITGLNTLQHSVWDGGSANRVLNASVSNMRIDNSVTCPRPLTPAFTINPVFCQGQSITADGTATQGSPAEIYHLWEITEIDMLGNPVPGNTWTSQWYDGEAGPFTFPNTDEGGPGFISCNKRYRVTLAVQSCGNPWATASRNIFVSCPDINASADVAVCEGGQTTLTANGHVISYEWTPSAGLSSTTGNTITASPTQTTTYTVTGTDATGCTVSDNVTVTVAPANLGLNISTGYDQNTSATLPSGSQDWDWRIRSKPGTAYTQPYSGLLPSIAVAPLVDPSNGWYQSPNVKWISTEINSLPLEVPATIIDGTPQDNYYTFEYQFNLPVLYSNLKISGTEIAADNCVRLYLNNNPEYAVTGFDCINDETNFTTNHNPGVFATNPAHYNVGSNTIRAEVSNGGGANGPKSYMGFLLNARLTGECHPVQKAVYITPAPGYKQTEDPQTIFVSPNPGNGLFTLTSVYEDIVQVVVTDMAGRQIYELNNLNKMKTELDLGSKENGVYFIAVWTKDKSQPEIKKILISK